MENLSEYITNNYGICKQVEAGKSCACIKHGWIGSKCFSWKPYEASTWEEVRLVQCGNTGVKQSEQKHLTTTERPIGSQSSEPLGSSLTE